MPTIVAVVDIVECSLRVDEFKSSPAHGSREWKMALLARDRKSIQKAKRSSTFCNNNNVNDEAFIRYLRADYTLPRCRIVCSQIGKTDSPNAFLLPEYDLLQVPIAIKRPLTLKVYRIWLLRMDGRCSLAR